MVNTANLAVNVLLLGALYSLIAIGFTLIFGVGGVLNLAHGAAITLGAYAAYYVTEAGFSIWIGAVAAFVLPGLLSYALYRGMIKRVAGHPITVLILTLVTGLVVEQVFLVVAGTQPLAIPALVGGQTELFSRGVENNRIAAVLLSWLLIGGLFYFVTRSKQGKAILAISMSKKGAALVGIEADSVYGYTWLIAGALAGIAGLFLASFLTANPLMGRNPLLLSFAIVVLGGLGSIRGSVLGAYLIALLDQVTVTMISTRLSGVAALVVLVVVLLVRPEGLFGRELAE
ncbi:MAG: branched-chain amino acid ABC transporter permease [Halobacteriales archaeon]|nr:branched-chain amino acid ABC transporter permease [Halobacteriales archaeon]